jgi:hypothetical protein
MFRFETSCLRALPKFAKSVLPPTLLTCELVDSFAPRTSTCEDRAVEDRGPHLALDVVPYQREVSRGEASLDLGAVGEQGRDAFTNAQPRRACAPVCARFASRLRSGRRFTKGRRRGDPQGLRDVDRVCRTSSTKPRDVRRIPVERRGPLQHGGRGFDAGRLGSRTNWFGDA